MEQWLLIAGAALLGLVVLALAVLWAYEQRRFIQQTLHALERCQDERENDFMAMHSAHERVHKVTQEVVTLQTLLRESQNHAQYWLDMSKTQKAEIDELKAALANRKPSRASDRE